MRGLAFATACAMGWMIPACVGTDTGNPVDGNGSGTGGTGQATGGSLGEGGYGCEEVSRTELALDEETSLGVTAEQVLALAAGKQTFSMQWSGEPGTWGALAGTTTMLTVSVSADPDGLAHLVERALPDPQSNGGAIEIGSPDDCDDQVQVDVVVELATADGALDETFDAVLRTSDALQASWSAKLMADEVRGSFDYQAAEGFVWTALSPRMTHTTLGAFGDLGVEGMSEDSSGPGGGAAFAAPAARWPADGDCTGGPQTDLDAPVGETSIATAFAELASPTHVEWPDGSSSELTWNAELEASSGCASLPGDFDEVFTLRASGTATVASADGQLDASVPFDFTAEVDEAGTLRSAALEHGGMAARMAPSELSTTYGLTTVDTDGYSEVSVALRWQHDLQTSGSPEGSLVVYGLTVPDCVSMPAPQPTGDGTTGGGSAGCAGIDSTPLLEATLSRANTP